METFIENVLFDYPYWALFSLSFGYFLLLYFGVGNLFLQVCKYLESRRIISKIIPKEVSSKQIAFEVRHSLKSIVVFGFSIIPIIYLIRAEMIRLLPNTWYNILIGVVILSLWNEVHFYIVHRLMHHKFMMKHVHFIHHQSKIPTIYCGLQFSLVGGIVIEYRSLNYYAICAVFHNGGIYLSAGKYSIKFCGAL